MESYRKRTAAKKAAWVAAATKGYEKLDAALCAWHARQHSTGTVQGLKAAIDEAMRDGACDLALIRRYARTAWRWVDAYNKGLDGVLAAWAVRKSKCHHFVTQEVDRRVNEMKVEQDRAMQARKEAHEARAEDPPVVLGVLADLVAAGALGDGDDE